MNTAIQTRPVTACDVARAIDILSNGTLFDDDPVFRERARRDALEIVERAREQVPESSNLTDADWRWISSSISGALSVVLAERLPAEPKPAVAKPPKQQSRTPSSPVRDAKTDQEPRRSDPTPGCGTEKSDPRTVWLSPKAACAYAKCSRQTLWRWGTEGLPIGRRGRVRRADLDMWLGGSTDQPCDENDELLTFQEAAARAGVTRQTIWSWSNDGLKVRRSGRLVRVLASVLDKYVKRRS